MQQLYRWMLDSGAEHVTWFVWRYQSKVMMRTPLLPRQGSMFFLDCGRVPFAVTAGMCSSGSSRTALNYDSSERGYYHWRSYILRRTRFGCKPSTCPMKGGWIE